MYLLYVLSIKYNLLHNCRHKDVELCTHQIFPVNFVFASKHKAESTRCMIVRRYFASIKFFRTRSRHAPKSSRDAQLLVDELLCPVLNYFVVRTCIYDIVIIFNRSFARACEIPYHECGEMPMPLLVRPTVEIFNKFRASGYRKRNLSVPGFRLLFAAG